MKSTLAAAVFALCVVLAGGCSTMHDRSTSMRPADVEDGAYVARVERTARDRGVSVHWVNPPLKRVASTL